MYVLIQLYNGSNFVSKKKNYNIINILKTWIVPNLSSTLNKDKNKNNEESLF